MENEIKVDFFSEYEEDELKYVVILSQNEGKWVFVRHKERTTWECPGGHIEEGEVSEEAAARELYEETGALDYDMTFLFYYTVTRGDSISAGKLFFADIYEFEEIPPWSEIGEVDIVSEMPTDWTYPQIQPHFFEMYEKIMGEMI